MEKVFKLLIAVEVDALCLLQAAVKRNNLDFIRIHQDNFRIQIDVKAQKVKSIDSSAEDLEFEILHARALKSGEIKRKKEIENGNKQ